MDCVVKDLAAYLQGRTADCCLEMASGRRLSSATWRWIIVIEPGEPSSR